MHMYEVIMRIIVLVLSGHTPTCSGHQTLHQDSAPDTILPSKMSISSRLQMKCNVCLKQYAHEYSCIDSRQIVGSKWLEAVTAVLTRRLSITTFPDRDSIFKSMYSLILGGAAAESLLGYSNGCHQHKRKRTSFTSMRSRIQPSSFSE